MVTIGSLCSGYGGLEIGLRAAVPDARVIWHAEVDPAASAVLERHEPDVPNLGSIIDRDWSTVASPDVLCAGFPCQPVSSAGRQLAHADPRWLWPAVREAIEALRPPVVFLENVRNIIAIQQGEIIKLIEDDLTALGYSWRWVIMGACHVGAPHHRHRWFLRAELADADADSHLTVERDRTALCGARRRSVPVLPSPQARDGDGRGEGDAEYWAARAEHRTNGMPLAAAVTLLPTPSAADGNGGGRIDLRERDEGNGKALPTVIALLPTPQARDGMGGDVASEYGGVRESGAKRAVSLGNAVRHKLLPTPRASDTGTAGRAPGEGFRPALSAALLPELATGQLLPTPRGSDGERGRGNPNQHGGRGDLMIGSAVQPSRWGAFAAAVARWELVTGVGVPEPTEANGNGNPRLRAELVEWMMGLPAGHVTATTACNDALRLLGNGAVPLQVAAAWRLLSGEVEKMTEAETTAPPAKRAKGPDPTFGAEDIESILAFHGTPVAAQVLREVLGQLGRAASAAAKRQPRNRAVEDFKAWNPPALRALAELCERYAPEVGQRTSPLDSRDAEMLPDAVDGEIASIEAQVIAERPELTPPAVVTAEPPVGRPIEVLTTVLGAEPLVRDPDEPADDHGLMSSLPVIRDPGEALPF